MTDKNVLVVGCSFAMGHGLENLDQNPLLWVNRIFDSSYKIHNHAIIGANNHRIFLQAVTALAIQEYDVVVAEWSAIPRYNYNVGLELNPTKTNLKKVDPYYVYKVKHHKISGKWLQETGERLRTIHNDHWDILDLIQYINVLVHLQSIKNKKIFFVNGLGPWCNGYFERKDFSLPRELSEYEQDLLSVEYRDDNDSIQLYKMIHQQYQQYGGIREELWLNLYSSLQNMQIDHASKEDPHPGLQSQNRYVDFLKPILEQKLKS